MKEALKEEKETKIRDSQIFIDVDSMCVANAFSYSISLFPRFRRWHKHAQHSDCGRRAYCAHNENIYKWCIFVPLRCVQCSLSHAFIGSRFESEPKNSE